MLMRQGKPTRHQSQTSVMRSSVLQSNIQTGPIKEQVWDMLVRLANDVETCGRNQLSLSDAIVSASSRNCSVWPLKKSAKHLVSSCLEYSNNNSNVPIIFPSCRAINVRVTPGFARFVAQGTVASRSRSTLETSSLSEGIPR